MTYGMKGNTLATMRFNKVNEAGRVRFGGVEAAIFPSFGCCSDQEEMLRFQPKETNKTRAV
jgi:hypothetical protein